MTKSLCVVSPHSGMFGPAEAGQDCGSCYQLDLGTVVGIVAGDLIVTLLIVLSVFCFVINQRRRRSTLNCHEGRKTPTVPSERTTAEVTESPYQELQGVHTDVYSDLEQFRK